MFGQTLEKAPVRSHLVEFYDDATVLAAKVADFAEPALRRNEAVVLIAIPRHLQLFKQTLQERGLPVDVIETSGRLICLDAARTLREFTTGGQVYWSRFEASIGTTIGHMSHVHGKVRAYGEMVNLLWQEGFPSAAIELEGFWNRLGTLYPFSLFCAYSRKVFNFDRYAEDVSSICAVHSHAYAESSDESFERIVQKMLLAQMPGFPTEQGLAQ